MDIFKFNNPTSPTRMEQGEFVNGLKRKMWVERYRDAGEFEFVGNADEGVREKLPIGSFVSHVDSTEVMVVENHEISDDKDKETEITVTGRSFETYLDNRIVGSNKSFPTTGGLTDYVLAADYTWNQVVELISDHILVANLVDPDDAIPYFSVLSEVTGTSVSTERTVRLGSLYSRVLELLDIDNIGIKVVRPGAWSPLGAGSPNSAIVIHKGVNRSSEIIFSHDSGEIERADYLWSNKKAKNCALVTGKWVDTLVTTTEEEYGRRMMHVDASDLDNSYSTAPTGATRTNIVNAMQQRGLEALASQKDIALTNTEVSKDANKAAYRKDFDLGDLITVNGNYNESATKRISEYVEIEDENGSSGYPTLTTP